MKWLSLVMVLGFGIAFITKSDVAAEDKKDITTKDVMKAVNGKGGIKKEIETALKGKDPKWDEVTAKAKELVPLAKAMAHNKAPKGDADSWEKLTKGYTEAAEKLEKAATDKDAKAAADAMKTLNACGACHKAHKP